MRDQPIIQFSSVSVTYRNGVQALTNVSLSIFKGEFVFFVGPTGQGKSTALKLIFRDVRPAAGEVVVAGEDISDFNAGEVAFLRRHIGVVFQDFRLLEHKTVRENLRFAMQVVDTPPHIIRRRVSELLAQVGLQERRDAFPQQLSGGEQQRLCIARALINHPPILLADEPTGNLDPATSVEIINLLEEINLKGTTIVMATHDREVVDRLRKRVVHFRCGQVVGDIAEGGYYPPGQGDCADAPEPVEDWDPFARQDPYAEIEPWTPGR